MNEIVIRGDLRTYVSWSFDEVEAKFNDNIVFVAEDFGDSARNPSAAKAISILDADSAEVGVALLFHNLQIDFLHVDLFAELWWKLGRLHEPRICS